MLIRFTNDTSRELTVTERMTLEFQDTPVQIEANDGICAMYLSATNAWHEVAPYPDARRVQTDIGRTTALTTVMDGGTYVNVGQKQITGLREDGTYYYLPPSGIIALPEMHGTDSKETLGGWTLLSLHVQRTFQNLPRSRVGFIFVTPDPFVAVQARGIGRRDVVAPSLGMNPRIDAIRNQWGHVVLVRKLARYSRT
jgi:hypothetical protein